MLASRYGFFIACTADRFARVRGFGFLHSNAKRLLILLQWVLKVVIQAAAPKTSRPFLCSHCHVPMTVVGMTPRSAATT